LLETAFRVHPLLSTYRKKKGKYSGFFYVIRWGEKRDERGEQGKKY